MLRQKAQQPLPLNNLKCLLPVFSLEKGMFYIQGIHTNHTVATAFSTMTTEVAAWCNAPQK
jgi:hypothetical protein